MTTTPTSRARQVVPTVFPESLGKAGRGKPHDPLHKAVTLADIARVFLQVQIAAGASAVQLFDSWAGTLSLADYEQFVLPHSRSVLDPTG